jgi:hypothetical protein
MLWGLCLLQKMLQHLVQQEEERLLKNPAVSLVYLDHKEMMPWRMVGGSCTQRDDGVEDGRCLMPHKEMMLLRVVGVFCTVTLGTPLSVHGAVCNTSRRG